MESEQVIYRVIFAQEEKIYEVYSRYLSENSLMGFIEIEELIFTTKGSVVIDPSEEKLQQEFKEVKRSYIPLHNVLRIDEVVKEGVAKIKENNSGGNVHHLGKFRHVEKD